MIVSNLMSFKPLWSRRADRILKARELHLR